MKHLHYEDIEHILSDDQFQQLIIRCHGRVIPGQKARKSLDRIRFFADLRCHRYTMATSRKNKQEVPAAQSADEKNSFSIEHSECEPQAGVATSQKPQSAASVLISIYMKEEQ